MLLRIKPEDFKLRSPDTYIDEEKLQDLLEICSLDAYLED